MKFIVRHDIDLAAIFGIALGVELVIASLVGRFFNRARQEGWLFPRDQGDTR